MALDAFRRFEDWNNGMMEKWNNGTPWNRRVAE